MKNLFKHLLLFLALLNIQPVQSQGIEPVTVTSDGVVTLKGKGKLGGNKDGAQWRRYKFARTGNFYISGYFRSLTNSTSSFTGLAFRNIPTNKVVDGGNATIGLFVENDTLKAKLKLNDNTRFIDVAVLPNVKLPVRLKIEKNNNSIKFYYSKDPENSISPIYTLITSVANAFTGWNDITQNFATGSKLTAAQTAVVSNISFGTVAADGTPSCTNGATFDVISITKTTGNFYNVLFNAANLSSVNINIASATNASVRNYTTNVTANPLSVDVGSQADGGYTLTLTGQSCVGVASKNFTIGSPTVSPAPTIASSPTVPVAGSAVTFTATGCSGTVNWFVVRGSNTTGTLGTNSILSVSSPVASDSYYATCTIGTVISAASNYIDVVSPVVEGGGNPVTAFVNYTKLAAFESALGKYNPDAFPTISVVNTADPILSNKLFPNWSISWKVEGLNFSSATRNNKTPKVGIPFMFDMLPVPYGGYGTRCVDYVYVQNPNTGQVWDSDENCSGSQFNQYFNNSAHTIANFSSALSFQERAGDGGGAGLDRITEWNGISDLSYFYNQGTIGAERFGLRDWTNGKANIGLSDYDNEGTHDDNKSLAILLGLASKSTGYVFDQYANILGAVYIDPSKYPNDFNNPNSTYPAWTQLVNGSDGESNSGNAGQCSTCQNNIPTRPFWNPTYKISIPSKFTGQKGIVDEPTILPSTEVSCISSATFRQGESYVYNTAGNTRVVNKFGLQANTQHMIARTIFAGETHKWYCVNKLNNRKMILQAKILCDQQQNGLLLSTDYVNTYINNQSLANKHFDREFSFDIGAFVAFTGCEWNIWDRNQQGVNLDGYHGAFGIINLLNQKKTFGNQSVSFVDLKPRAKFLLWTSQISYDGGTTYVQEKANKYVMAPTSIPQRQIITTDGYWSGILTRPENTEGIVNGNLITVKLKVTHNGTDYFYTVTPDMWETTDYGYRNTALASLPNDKKDYHYFLIKLGSPVVESTTLTAPSISSNVNSPTTGQSVMLTSSGCGSGQINKWYTGDEGNYLASGLTYSFSAVNGNSYFAKCTTTTQSSAASNTYTVFISDLPPPSAGTTTITEPNKPQYYFSNGHAPEYYANNVNLPAVHKTGTRPDSNSGNKLLSGITMQSTYSPTNDLVWLQNNKVKVGINLLRGGQMAYFSTATSNKNLIYNGYDGGFQITCDIYQRPDGYTQNGKTSRFSANPNSQIASYNTTMGGDFNNNSQSVYSYYAIPNGYVVEYRPLFYTMDCEWSQVTIRVKYTLEPGASSVRCEYTYHSFRTDGQYNNNTFDSSALPACFVVNDLTRYQFYAGNSPWNYSAVEDGIVPITNTGGRYVDSPAEPVKDAHATERWSLVYNPNTSRKETIAVYIPTSASSEYTKIKQLEVYAANGTPQGNQFNGGFTYFDFARDLASIAEPIPDRSNFTKTMVAYVIATETEGGMDGPANARKEAYRLKTLLGN